ncbi:hypothetical protein JB92DRAFT_3146840 [Gautieria morchelliformis]|nr:hypothetical protein JB92DRAFT_3146840 [Gautieria morchelliformis]
MLHHSGSPILLLPLGFASHPANHRDFTTLVRRPPLVLNLHASPPALRLPPRPPYHPAPPLPHRHSPAADRPPRRENTHHAPFTL